MGQRRKSHRRFDRRKNDIRRARILKGVRHETRQSSSILSAEVHEMSSSLQQPDSNLLDRHHLNASISALCEQATGLCDGSWRIVQSEHNIQIFMVDGISQPVITRSVTVATDLSWSVFICGKQLIVDDTPVLRHINSTNALSVLLEHVKSSNTCPES